MWFEQLKLGGNRNLCYVFADEESKAAAVVDPCYQPEKQVDLAEEKGFQVSCIVLTHSHSDHIGGVDYVRQRTGARIVAHPDSEVTPDLALADGDRFQVGRLEVQAIHTPGHSPDSICLLVEGKLIAGDLLFVGKVGGTGSYFQGSSARQEFDSLHEKILTLDDSIEVYPGHDFGTKPMSTIGEERRTNPFLLQKSFEEFQWLKDHWEEYKKEHGIN